MKTGDRVRIHGERFPHHAGKVGTVLCVSKFARGPSIHVEVYPEAYVWFYPRELAPIPSCCIEVGDRVRVIQVLGFESHLEGYVGQQGVVVRWTSDEPGWDGEDWSNERIVRFDDGEERCVYWEEMELVEGAK